MDVTTKVAGFVLAARVGVGGGQLRGALRCAVNNGRRNQKAPVIVYISEGGKGRRERCIRQCGDQNNGTFFMSWWYVMVGWSPNFEIL